ncbi:hypothetical protein COCMIDRAFT_40690 [Bipolaris oryzae ATCC 44560]|uniref:Zn(2)-C6 fungal-type domain-containing protein n=1 Tax=Bipolaris oryzae ATCC 44560 TaxID=930090 RepID=W6YU76_COCMI|nr:uncharacterized protein COCMIDRAFT_40690 [Bipolaris oryzae ATCC 44560]EUC41083.1 hypothetical protein COCMIDRAFT_40690 [Bipolaris oryzae ATCC 44560]
MKQNDLNARLKVRTGCSVCKIRHVKCDEKRPFCTKCTSTGRTCSGYVSPPPRKIGKRRSKYDTPNMPLGQRVAVYPASHNSATASVAAYATHAWQFPRYIHCCAFSKAEWDETRSLHYYRVRVSKRISSCFDVNFWENTVPQMTEEEPAIRHAIVALSSYYEAGELSRLSESRSAVGRHSYLVRLAIYEHNNAISTLLNQIHTKGQLTEVVVMSCLIFAWLEFLQNNVDDALKHLRSGLRILAEQQQTPCLQQVAMQVAHISGRLITQAMLHGYSTVEFDYSAIMHSMGSRSSSFATLRDARRDLDGMINDAFCFLGQLENLGYTESHHGRSTLPDFGSLRDEYQDHVRNFDQWRKAFGGLRDRIAAGVMKVNVVQAMHQLELCYLLISNTFETLFATTPMVYDEHNHTFARILYLSKQLRQYQILHESNSLFTIPFDYSIQGALFYIILRCRHLPIRKEAMQLLQLCPDHEGLWPHACLVAFCKWKIDFEEKGRPQGALETDPLPVNARVHGEEARCLVKDIQTLVVVSYKRGVLNGPVGVTSDVEEVTNMSTRLVGLLRLWRAWPLYPTIKLKDTLHLSRDF